MPRRWGCRLDNLDDEVGHIHFDLELDKVHERVKLNVAVEYKYKGQRRETNFAGYKKSQSLISSYMNVD